MSYNTIPYGLKILGEIKKKKNVPIAITCIPFQTDYQSVRILALFVAQ